MGSLERALVSKRRIIFHSFIAWVIHSAIHSKCHLREQRCSRTLVYAWQAMRDLTANIALVSFDTLILLMLCMPFPSGAMVKFPKLLVLQ